MQCSNCGTQFADDTMNCPNCGAPAANPFQQGQVYQQPYGAQNNMSKKEFLHHPSLKKCRNNINSSAIILYICAGLTLVLGILSGNFYSFLDVVLVAGLGLGIQLAQSRACAIIICVYSGINTLYMTVSTGRPGGYLILIASIYAIIATFKFQKSWNEYKRTGILPPA